MKKLLASLAIAGGMVGMMTGAHAQTITGVDASDNTLFTVLLTPSVTSAPAPYTYSYLATLESDPGKLSVNTFTFNFGSSPISYDAADSTLGSFSEVPVGNGTYIFTSSNGLELNGTKTATFAFQSPLPPDGSVSASSNAGNYAAGGTTSIGPGAAVPEPATLALLGLGALPLAFVARRRTGVK